MFYEMSNYSSVIYFVSLRLQSFLVTDDKGIFIATWRVANVRNFMHNHSVVSLLQRFYVS